MVNSNLMGPDSKPLVTKGTIGIIFTQNGHAFRHQFIVVEGGDLLLLGNDFLARYNASITPLNKGGDGKIEINGTMKCTTRRHQLAVSCKPPGSNTSPAGSASYCKDPMDKDSMDTYSTNKDSMEPATTAETYDDPESTASFHSRSDPRDRHATASSIGRDQWTTSPQVTPNLTGPTADERFHSELRTDTYLLYCEKPVSIRARNEVTIWVRAFRFSFEDTKNK